jgi:hypothetical protein
MVQLKTKSSEVDPVFCCRLCKARGYQQEENDYDSEEHAAQATRTKSPSNPSQDLAWVNHVLDFDCYQVLIYGYRLDRVALGPWDYL